MSFSAWRGIQIGFFLAILVAILPACSRNEPPVDAPRVEFGQKVSGKVTYDGQAVPFGFVMFYSLEAMAAKGGEGPAAATAMISEGGKYEMPNVPLGPMLVCVVTDPDADPAEFLKPAFADRPAPDKGPPSDFKGGPPDKGMFPPDKGPKGSKKDAGPDKGPPKGFGPPKMPNPFVEKLTNQEKETLRAIHTKYGDSKTPKLNYMVRPGEQTFDIQLER